MLLVSCDCLVFALKDPVQLQLGLETEGGFGKQTVLPENNWMFCSIIQADRHGYLASSTSKD